MGKLKNLADKIESPEKKEARLNRRAINNQQFKERWDAQNEKAAAQKAAHDEKAAEQRRIAELARQERIRNLPDPRTTGQHGLVCPHCQSRGTVTSKQGKQKQGISGGKATGALLTGGISLLGTGLSRKSKVTTLTCRNCKLSWSI